MCIYISSSIYVKRENPMLDFETAKMHLKNTMDSAFSKNIGTKNERVRFAKRICRMVPTNSDDSVNILIWSVGYASDWTLN